MIPMLCYIFSVPLTIFMYNIFKCAFLLIATAIVFFHQKIALMNYLQYRDVTEALMMF